MCDVKKEIYYFSNRDELTKFLNNRFLDYDNFIIYQQNDKLILEIIHSDCFRG